MANFIALDIALIPSEKHYATLEKWNKKLYQNGDTGYLFSKNHLPHLTLFQNFILADDLPKLLSDIDRVSLPEAIRELKSSELISIPFKDDFKICMLNFENTDPLSSLQQQYHQLLQKYSKQPTTEAGIKGFCGDCIPEAVSWVQKFSLNASLNKFSPHITLGFSKLDLAETITPEEASYLWQFDSVKLAKMGNYCSLSGNIYWDRNFE